MIFPLCHCFCESCLCQLCSVSPPPGSVRAVCVSSAQHALALPPPSGPVAPLIGCITACSESHEELQVGAVMCMYFCCRGSTNACLYGAKLVFKYILDGNLSSPGIDTRHLRRIRQSQRQQLIVTSAAAVANGGTAASNTPTST